LHRIKEFSHTDGFPWALRFSLPSKLEEFFIKLNTVVSLEGGFRWRDEKVSRQKKK
jgi:hypothetical protein